MCKFRKSNQDLTLRYYSSFFFRILRHNRIRYKYLKFKNEPKEKQFLEHIVTIIVQWFMPYINISYSYIKELLDNVAWKVLQNLRKGCPTHSIFTMANDYIVYWKDNNINYSYWNYTEMLSILVITDEIISSSKYFFILNQLWLTQNISHNHVSYYIYY